MNKGLIFLPVFLIAIGLIAGISPGLVWAQEEGVKETFDDPTLPGWEHSKNVMVADGVLKLSPGDFALRFGDWSDITLTIKVKYSGTGSAIVSYSVKEGGKYGVIINDGHLAIEKEQNQASHMLGEAQVSDIMSDTWITLKVVVSGQQHQIYVNDTLQLTLTDPDPLSPGPVLLQAIGETSAEFDDLEISGVTTGELAGEAQPPAAGGPQDVAQPPVPGGTGEQPTDSGFTKPGGQTTSTGQNPSQAGIIQEFFASQASRLDLTTFLINLILAAICAQILGLVYIYWGSSLTNRRRFAANFMLLTVTTTFIILIVRSSVALSLGLVGALSIVRFRTAVKEAEELAYLFFAISLGIGLGDNQRLISLLALAIGILIIGLRQAFRRPDVDTNLYLNIASYNPDKITLEQIMDVLRSHTTKMRLQRFDENRDTLEVSFIIELKRMADLNKARAALRALSESLEITFLDNKGIW